MMKPLMPTTASKAADVLMSEPVATTRGLLNRFGTRTKREGSSPSGYVWLWRSSLLGWRRRFIVTSPEAPGVVMIYKDNSLKGKVLSVGLCDATVKVDEQEARQLKIVTHTKGEIFIQASDELERNDWVACLHESILSSSRGVTQPTTPSLCGGLIRASSTEQPANQEQEFCGDPVSASSNDDPVTSPDVGGKPADGSYTAQPAIQNQEVCGYPVRASSNDQATIQEQDVHGDPVEVSSTAPPVIAPYGVDSRESFLSCVTYAETAHEDTFDVDDNLDDDEVSHEGHMAVSCSSSSFSSCTLPSSTSSSTTATPKEMASPADELYKLVPSLVLHPL
eukprot:gene13337-19176_t